MYRIDKNILHSFQGDFKILVKKRYILEEFYGSFPGVSRMIREVSHVCENIQCTSCNLEQEQPASYCYCLGNEWESLKLVHFETVRLNRGSQNKLLQNSMFSLSIFFLDII